MLNYRLSLIRDLIAIAICQIACCGFDFGERTAVIARIPSSAEELRFELAGFDRWRRDLRRRIEGENRSGGDPDMPMTVSKVLRTEALRLAIRLSTVMDALHDARRPG